MISVVPCVVLFLATVKLNQRQSLRVRIATLVLLGFMTDCRELFELVSFELPVIEGQSYAATVWHLFSSDFVIRVNWPDDEASMRPHRTRSLQENAERTATCGNGAACGAVSKVTAYHHVSLH
jgi:hypothetical protein